MIDKPYTKVGKTYYPRSPIQPTSGTEVIGSAWRAWIENGEYYYEYDNGHFATKLKTVKISKEDFELLKEGKISDADLARKYG